MKIIIGVVPGASATKGANMVAALAKRLQIPNAVDPKTAGYNYELAKYATLKVPLTPNLAPRIKIERTTMFSNS